MVVVTAQMLAGGSDDSSIDLLQKGFGNSATIDQWNSKDSVINVKQFGGGNGAAVDQTASGSTVTVHQLALATTRPHTSTDSFLYQKTGHAPCFFFGRIS